VRRMRRRPLLVGLFVGLATLVGFWFAAISPRLDRAAELSTEVASAEQAAAAESAAAEDAAAARREFPAVKTELAGLSKAVPKDSATASLVVELDRLSRGTGVDVGNLALVSGGEGSEPAAPADDEAIVGAPDGSSESATEPGAGTTTEATAADLPFGATAGDSGIAEMNYTLEFSGEFFSVAAFISALEDQVEPSGGAILADGRLLTIEGVTLTSDEGAKLTATAALTAYVAPPGGTPAAPASETTATGAPVESTPAEALP
jgi:hypothetical protein